MKKILTLLIFITAFSSLFSGQAIMEHHPNIGGLFDDAVEFNSSFDSMAGVMAYDYYDGYITDKLKVSGSVNTSIPGEYILTYSVTNSANDTKTIERRITVLPAGKFAVIHTTGRVGSNNIIDLDDSYLNRLSDNLTFIKPIITALPDVQYEFKLMRFKWDLTEDSKKNPNIKAGHKETPPTDAEWEVANSKDFYKDLYLCLKPRTDSWLKIIITRNGMREEWVYGLKGDDGVAFVSPQDGKTYYYLTREVDDPQTSEEQYNYYKHGGSFWYGGSNAELKRMGSRVRITTMGTIVEAYDMFDPDEIHGIYTTARAFGPGDKWSNSDDNWKVIMNAWNHTLLRNMNTSYHRIFEIFFSECKIPGWMDIFEEKYREIRQKYNSKRIYMAVSSSGQYSAYKNFYDIGSPYFQFEWHKGHFPKMYKSFPGIGDDFPCYSQYPRVNEVFSLIVAIYSYETHRDIHHLAMHNKISAALFDKCGFLNKIDREWVDTAKIYYAMWFCYEGYDYLNNGVFFRYDWDGDGLTNEEEYALDSNPFDADTDGDLVFDADEAAFHMKIKDPSDASEDKDGDRMSNLTESILRKATPGVGTGTPAFQAVHIMDESGNMILINGDNYKDGEWDPDKDLLPVWFEALSNANPMDLHTYKNGYKGVFSWVVDVAKWYAGVTKMIAYNNDIVGDDDVDKDGISNLDEIIYGLDPNNPSDATEDLDGDGVSNSKEIEDGTLLCGDDTDGPEFFASIVKPPAFVGVMYDDFLIYDAVPPDVMEKFTFSKIAGPAWLLISNTGLLSGTPTGTDSGINTFTIRINDGMGRSTQTDFDIEVLLSSSFSLTVDSGVGSGTYRENSIVNIEADSAQIGKEFFKWDGDTQYVNDQYNSHTFVTMPGKNITISATYKFESRHNNAPFANDDHYNVIFATTLSINPPGIMVNDSDMDGDALTITKTSDPHSGVLELNSDGSLKYTPQKDFIGEDSFTYVITDGTARSHHAVVYFNVFNREPVSNNDDYQVRQGFSLSVSASGVLKNDTDFENDALTVQLENGPSDGTLNFNTDGSFKYTPNSSFTGKDIFSYFAVDPYSKSKQSATVTIEVLGAGIDIRPLAMNDSYSTNQDTVLNISSPGVLYNDSVLDGKSLSAVLAHYPLHGELTLNTNGGFSYTPENGFFGDDSFTYRASNGTLTSDIAIVNLSIIGSVASKYNLNVENGSGSGYYLEGTGIAIAPNIPQGKLFDFWSGAIAYINDSNLVLAKITMPAQDITITANFKDAPPSTYSISGTVVNDSNVPQSSVALSLNTGVSTSTDINGSYSFSGLMDGAYTITPSLNGYVFIPQNAHINIAGANVRTGADFTAEKTTNGNSPVAVDDAYNLKTGTLFSSVTPGILKNDYGYGNAALTVFVITQPQHGTLQLASDGGFTYQPNSGFSGTDSFTYKASDGQKESNLALVTLNVYEITDNIPPDASGDSYAITINSTLTVVAESGVLANDSDLNDTDSLTAEIATMPTSGILTFNSDGSFEYIPEKDFSGIVQFTYRALDNNRAYSSPAIVNIEVEPFNVTIGTPVVVRASEVLGNEKFVKTPKIYGVIDGKIFSLKKDKAHFSPEEAVCIWSRKVTLYDRKAMKTGYASYFQNGNPQKAKEIELKVKMKTQLKEKVDKKVAVAKIVPPLFISFQIGKDIVSEATPGAFLIINGEYFGEKIPKVALLIDNKLVKCKVNKVGLIYKNYKGKPSPMDMETGLSRISVMMPSKNIHPGTYEVIIDNKIGIATDENGALPTIVIK